MKKIFVFSAVSVDHFDKRGNPQFVNIVKPFTTNTKDEAVESGKHQLKKENLLEKTLIVGVFEVKKEVINEAGYIALEPEKLEEG